MPTARAPSWAARTAIVGAEAGAGPGHEDGAALEAARRGQRVRVGHPITLVPAYAVEKVVVGDAGHPSE